MAPGDFSWVSRHPLLMVTAVRGLTITEVSQRWGDGSDGSRSCTASQVERWFWNGDGRAGWGWAMAQQWGSVVVVWEVGSQLALQTGALEELTQGGVAGLAVGRTERVSGEFRYAEDGCLVVGTNRLVSDELMGTDPDRLQEHWQRAGLDSVRPRTAGCLGLMQRLFDVSVEYPDPDAPVLAFQLRPRPSVTSPPGPPRVPGPGRAVLVTPTADIRSGQPISLGPARGQRQARAVRRHDPPHSPSDQASS